MDRISTFFLACIFIFCAATSQAQIGGRYVYEFLNLSQSARVTALGGGLISVVDDDVTLAFSNPALLNPKMDQQISFNHNFHFADISHGFFNYGHYIDAWQMQMHAGISYISYGDFVRADVFGNNQGTFDARETAITIGASRILNERMTVGANIKAVTSRLDSYSSFGVAGDLGMTYENTAANLTIGAVFRNIGSQISTYNGTRENLPFNIQIGVSKRFAHLPFRLSIVAHTLNRWDIRFDDPNQEDPISLFGEPQETSSFNQSIDNFFRHFIFNGEFLIGKRENFRLRFGYNHLRRKELSVSEFRNLGGFSIGFGLKVKKFRFDYGVGYYHLAGAVNHLSLSTNLKEFKKKI